ncbi:MAG: protein translocase subunit SecD [Defluviitaleaceae bacterium]|nr:protein translocase subunit SecD [Defluviitaleaceae bacterium]
MKKKNATKLILIALAAVVLGYTAYFGFGSDRRFSAFDIRLGLDLQGGVSIVYEADIPNPTSEQMSAANSLIRGRLDRLGYTEADVATQGSNRIAVDIPGVDDAESAVDLIGRTAMLTFVDMDGNILLSGQHVANAQRSVETNQMGVQSIVIALRFTPEGSVLFEQATAANIGRQMLIMLDDDILMSPTVNERISSMDASITGVFTAQEADEYAALIRSGSLPFNLTTISMKNVGARLGMESLNTSILAGIIGFTLVVIFMIVIYRLAGVVASIALFLFLCIQIIVLSAFNVTLTLPGIAGIILSVGMATDANIIIFERIKEEIKSGRSVSASFKAGFTRAFPAIVDCNITALIASLILFAFGTGPVRGFATTLSIGVVISMFTALVISKMLLDGLINCGIQNPALYSVKMDTVEAAEANA